MPGLAARVEHAAAELSGVPVAVIRERTRRHDVAHLRFAVFETLKRRGLSYPVIASQLGFDHTSIMHGCERARFFAKIDPDYEAFLNKLAEAAA